MWPVWNEFGGSQLTSQRRSVRITRTINPTGYKRRSCWQSQWTAKEWMGYVTWLHFHTERWLLQGKTEAHWWGSVGWRQCDTGTCPVLNLLCGQRTLVSRADHAALFIREPTQKQSTRNTTNRHPAPAVRSFLENRHIGLPAPQILSRILIAFQVWMVPPTHTGIQRWVPFSLKSYSKKEPFWTGYKIIEY